ncbi:MAG: hypothetical protein Q8R26_03740 [bacterium]|nr:hypothetical protein [bacterium]
MKAKHCSDLVETPSKEGSFPTKVNYDLSVESLVEHGRYDWKNRDIISDSFRTGRKGEANLSLELVHLNQEITSEEVLKELDKRGLRPAELHELLSFGIKYPEEQRKYPIVALGSVWRNLNGVRGVAGLVGGGGWHGDWRGGWRDLALYLDDFGSRWRVNCRFAAVRK